MFNMNSVRFGLFFILTVANNEYVDSSCQNQLQTLLQGVNKNENWALHFYDSWGRWPSGQFSGNQYDFGNYDQCREYIHQHDTVGIIAGRYCMVVVPRTSKYGRIFIDTGGIDGVVIGMCFPKICDEKDLKDPVGIILETMYQSSALDFEIKCEEQVQVPQMNHDVALSFFSVIAGVVILSTIYSIICHNPSDVLSAFSVYSNWFKLMKTSEPISMDSNHREKSNMIDSIHGIRVLAIVWIIFGHSYMLVTSAPLTNSLSTFTWMNSFHSTLIIAGPLSVDTFFLLSGLLTCWSLLKELDRNRRINVPLMYLHRYLRLTPVFAALILFTIGMLPKISSGPLWNTSLELSVDLCNQYWWSALLYVQNYVNPNEICLGHSWYLSVDMQLFIVSPFLIYPLWKWGSKMLVLVGFLTLVPVGYIFTMFMVYDFPASILITDLIRDRLTYLPTHARMGPWMIGLATDYIMYRTKDRFVRLSKLKMIMGWSFSLMVLTGCIIGAHFVNQPVPGSRAQIYDALYEALKHVLWPAGVAWIIFACCNGFGGPINSVLSMTVWQPIGKLSYCLYLLHLPIQTMLTASLRTVRHFSDLQAVHTFWGDLALTMLAAIGWTLCFEIPFANLDTLLLAKVKRRPV